MIAQRATALVSDIRAHLNPASYQEFINALISFKRKAIDIEELLQLLLKLFHPYPELLCDLATSFVPPGYLIVDSEHPWREIAFFRALSLIQKIKVRFADRPAVHEEFLRLLGLLRAGHIGTEQLSSKAKYLFEGCHDLYVEFLTFVPVPCLEDELDRLVSLPFLSFDMENSDDSSSSTPATGSGSQARPGARPRDRQATPASSAGNPANPALTSEPHSTTQRTSRPQYPTADPFPLVNNPQTSAGPHSTFPPVYFPGSPRAGLPATHIPGVNPFADFPNTHSSPSQFQPHLGMWPFIPQQGGASFNPPPQTPLPYPTFDAGPSRSTHHASPPVASTSQMSSTPSPPQGQDDNDPEEIAMLEDKRRRNTAASARFRIKKKQKTLNLERTVSDLSSRAEELEREATNLRRENTWLKEIVIMKGRGNMGGSRGSHGKETPSDSDSEGGDSTSEEDSGKGKGKAKAKEKEMGKGKGNRKSGKKK